MKATPEVEADMTRILEPLLTAKEVATYLNCRKKRVYDLEIPSIRISSDSLRWRRSDIEQFLVSRTEGTLS